MSGPACLPQDGCAEPVAMAGRAGYFEVLEAQQELFPAEDALARTQASQLLVIVQLYKAPGGGWSDPSPKPSADLR